MKHKFNEKTQKLTFQLEDKDFYDAVQIEEMMKGIFQCRKCGTHFESKGWDILNNYLSNAREIVIESGKEGISSRIKRQLSDLKFAQLRGLDYARKMPEMIITQANMERDLKIKKEDVRNAADYE